jgi:outer membrane protein assembly factor BamE
VIIFNFIRRVLALAALGLALGACVYRIDIQQGNLLEEGDVDLLTVGMERSQVQYLLGTPTINDAFHRDRWDYPYYYAQGRSENVARRWLVVYFDGDRVSRIERDLELQPQLPP